MTENVMGTEALYQQYSNYLTSSESQWQLAGADGNDMCARIRTDGLDSMMWVNRFDSGIMLSRTDARGHTAYRSKVEHFKHNFSLFFMLGGRVEIRLPDGSYHLPRSGEIWTVCGEWENVDETVLPENGRISALHLDFSPERLSSWQEEGLLAKSLAVQAGTYQIRPWEDGKALLPFARALQNKPFVADSLSRLELESAALDLTVQLLRLSLPENKRVNRTRIDEAVDIIRAEFASNLTIAALARRVGVNECYFKRDFKAQTGETVAQYIRRLRMEHALRLLLQGKKVQQVMYFCGYRHIGNFNQAFSNCFGYLPADVVQWN